jgi:hypothetical protein
MRVPTHPTIARIPEAGGAMRVPTPPTVARIPEA